METQLEDQGVSHVVSQFTFLTISVSGHNFYNTLDGRRLDIPGRGGQRRDHEADY